MALYTSSWGRPIQGISQQPPKTRGEGQATHQLNAVSSAVRGLYKRNGSELLHDFGRIKISSKTKYHTMKDSDGVEYALVLEGGGVNVLHVLKWGRPHQQISVDDYMTCESAIDDIEILTIADTTLFLNNKILPRESNEKSGDVEKRVIVSSQFADYGKTYSIFLDGLPFATYKTPDGSIKDHINYVDTSYVAMKLHLSVQETINAGELVKYPVRLPPIDRKCEAILANEGHNYHILYPQCVEKQAYDQKVQDETYDFLYAEADRAKAAAAAAASVSITVDRNTIILSNLGGRDVTTEDGTSGKDLIVVAGRTSSIEKLPTIAPEGYVVEVTGSGSKATSYYLKAVNSRSGSIKWVETVAPNTVLGLDASTMPRMLVQDAQGNFSIQLAPWAGRKVGDSKSNLAPPFAETLISSGEPLTNLGVFQNRLFFMAGEAVTYSKSNDFFNFYKDTVQDELPDETLSIYSDTDTNNKLNGYAILDGDLVFFSPNGQFLQSGDKPITPENANLKYVSTFESLEGVDPTTAGDVIYFAYHYGGDTGIREFFTDSIIATKKAVPITDHVSRFIKGRARLLLASGSQNYLFVLAEPRNTIYVYQWMWQGDDRVQSAWSKWEFQKGDSVEHISIELDRLRIFIRTAKGNITLEQITLSEELFYDLPFHIKLDRKARVVFRRQGTLGWWRADMPYWAQGMRVSDLTVVQGKDCLDVGSEVRYKSDLSEHTGLLLFGEIYTEDELQSQLLDRHGSRVDEVECIIGVKYNFEYEPTSPYLRDGNGHVMDSDRLTINTTSINYDAIGKLKVLVENDVGLVREYNTEGRVLGKVGNIVGVHSGGGGTFTVPIRQQNTRFTIKLVSDSHREFQLRDMEWSGQFKQRGRRL